MSAKACKYECGTQITWDTAKKSFVESDGTLHTKERCESLRQKGPKPASGSNEHLVEAMNGLAAATRELAAAIRARGL